MSLSTLVKAETFDAIYKVFFFVIYNDRFGWRCILARYVIVFFGC